LGRVRPRAIDAWLAVLVTLAVAIAISVSGYSETDTRPPDALAYALGVTIGVLLLARRRWPVGVLIASVVTLQVYNLANCPGISAAVPLAVALYTAAAAVRLRWFLGVAALYLGGVLLYAVLYSGSPGPVLNELVRDGSLLVAVLLLGDAVRSHRGLMAVAADRLRRVEQDREREVRELSAARVIQQQLLPKELPPLPGWRVAAHYQPARAVGGDFYDFLELPDGQVALVTGDVTGKGIPAALVRTTTPSILRGDAPTLVSAGAVLERANDRLYPAIPAHMFVTCLYAVLDPESGRLRNANAGHNLPYLATADGSRSFAQPGCRSAPCPVWPTRRTRPTSLPATAYCSTATASPRRTIPPARCSAFQAAEGRREKQRKRAPHRRVPRRAERVRRARLGAGGRHHPRDARAHAAVLVGDDN
jgi:hypothetical protein